MIFLLVHTAYCRASPCYNGQAISSRCADSASCRSLARWRDWGAGGSARLRRAFSTCHLDVPTGVPALSLPLIPKERRSLSSAASAVSTVVSEFPRDRE